MQKDYYKILGVAPGVSEVALKEAYRRLAKKYHPDLVADAAKKAEYTERFKEINEAYRALSGTKRAQPENSIHREWQYVEFEVAKKQFSRIISALNRAPRSAFTNDNEQVAHYLDCLVSVLKADRTLALRFIKEIDFSWLGGEGTWPLVETLYAFQPLQFTIKATSKYVEMFNRYSFSPSEAMLCWVIERDKAQALTVIKELDFAKLVYSTPLWNKLFEVQPAVFVSTAISAYKNSEYNHDCDLFAKRFTEMVKGKPALASVFAEELGVSLFHVDSSYKNIIRFREELRRLDPDTLMAKAPLRMRTKYNVSKAIKSIIPDLH